MSSPGAGSGREMLRPTAAWRAGVVVGAAALGLWSTVAVAVRLIHRAEGYVPGETDCDDCGVTLVLDNLGWLAAAVAAYVGALIVAWWLLRSRGRRPGSPGE